VEFSSSSRNRLTHHDRDRFPAATLFDRLGRAVCKAGCVPRKELYEAWEVGRRVRRIHRGGRIVDVGGGHGLLAHVMLLLDNSSPRAIVVDPTIPSSATTLHETLAAEWPRLHDRVTHVTSDIDTFPLHPNDLVVSCHACGALTDRILDRAAALGTSVAVLPCCHDFATCDSGALGGWMDRSLAIDALRAVRLEQRGYRVWTQTIPASITPKNRLLIAIPFGSSALPL
jgi:hypothetical protein